MDAAELKELQTPIKARYRDDPDAAIITLKAQGAIGEGVTCSVETGRALVEAGLHPATGGTGLHACSGDMLLEALVACAGVTLNAVATALELDVQDARITAEVQIRFPSGPLRYASRHSQDWSTGSASSSPDIRLAQDLGQSAR